MLALDLPGCGDEAARGAATIEETVEYVLAHRLRGARTVAARQALDGRQDRHDRGLPRAEPSGARVRARRSRAARRVAAVAGAHGGGAARADDRLGEPRPLAGFERLAPDEQDSRLERLAAGWVAVVGAPLSGAQLASWFDDLCADLVKLWLAHPASLARVGFDGFATGGDGMRKQGFYLLAAGAREDWEPAHRRRRAEPVTAAEPKATA